MSWLQRLREASNLLTKAQIRVQMQKKHAAQNALKASIGAGVQGMGVTGSPGGLTGPMHAGNPTQQAGQQANRRSDQRFRSFAERYLVTRSNFFRQDPNGMAEDTYTCILDARRAYALIKRVGMGVGEENPEDSSF